MNGPRRRCVLHGCDRPAPATGMQFCVGHRDALTDRVVESLRPVHYLDARTEAGALALLEALTPTKWERGK